MNSEDHRVILMQIGFLELILGNVTSLLSNRSLGAFPPKVGFVL